MSLPTIFNPKYPLSLAERRSRLAELLWASAARRLPKRLAYWSFIHQGVTHIRNDEIVPEVGYTEVLQRMAK